MTLLLIATRNTHKLEEIRYILGKEYLYRSLADFANSPTIVEDADTFVGNARKKSETLACWLATNPDPRLAFELSKQADPTAPMFVLADDSGLEVDALEGAPGVHSARFAALETSGSGNSSDADNNAKLLRLLADVPGPRRIARFRCVITLTRVPPPRVEGASPVCYADEFTFQTEVFDGACEGRIGFEPQGREGFGYDPLFFPVGYVKSFATLGRAVKHEISHRAIALAKLREHIRKGGLK
jgi:XTP/dITP diphosphohydrolase